ncbi:MAG: four helix bundle protein [Patescibacteria group bacterium]|nr:four helix bundle protein [Patescibacteria group bacterium]
MFKEEFKDRTKKFSLRIIKLIEALPKTKTGEIVGKQLLRCGTSVAANYRAACRGKSDLDFLSKMGIVEEEADESIFWLEIIIDSGLMREELVFPLLQEGNEILAIVISSKITFKKRLKDGKDNL